MGVERTIDITAGQRKTILTLLERHLPGTEAWVYGSRAKWTSRPQSDLDLVVFATPAQRPGVGNLREAFEESDLPFRVDLFVCDEVPEAFQKEIEAEHVVLVEGRAQVAASQQLFGTLPDGWEYTTLGVACAAAGGNIQTGPFGSQLHASDYVPSGIPSIMPQNIGDNRILADGIARITPDDASRLSRYLVREGDIVYSRRGDVKRRALVRSAEDGWLCGTGCLRIRLGKNGADSRYASYYLGHPDVQDWIVRHAHGATMPNLNTSILSECPFVIPSKPEQRAIAQILGTLDDKIDLNRRMNETLEAMAWAQFKDWFVDFGPIRAKAEGRDPGLPQSLADLFPAGLVHSELGEIPEGWEMGTLDDVAEHRRRSVRPSQIDPETPYIALEHMPKRCIALSNWATGGGIESNKFEFKRGELLFGKLRPYFHKVGVAPTDGVCSTDIVVIRPQPQASFGFVLGHVSSVEFVDYTDAGSMGTRMPRTNWDEMARYKLVLPPEPIAKSFDTLIRPSVARIIFNIHESRMLAAVRDTLLPKLTSGDVRLCDAAKAVEAVA